MLSLVWWSALTVAGIWLQMVVPGVDFLAPGLLLCIQLEKKTLFFWLLIVWSLIQEGVGGLPFGYSILWYSSIVALYRCGELFFDVHSIMFAILCGAGLGVLHPLLTWMMAMLADMHWTADRYFLEGILQFIIFPLEWALLKYLYPERLKHEFSA